MPAEMTWLGHATIRLALPDERVILIDPWLKENPSCPDRFKQLARCDFIVLTHGHFDHIDDVASIVEDHNPKVVGMVELCTALGMRTPKAQYQPMNLGGTQTIDGVSFTLTQAFHSSSIDSEQGPIYTGMPAGVVINVEGVATFYHAGDTDVFGDMKLIAKLHKPKIAALPIGDHFTMGPAGAALAAQMLQPQCIVPIHYGTFPVLTGTPDGLRDALPAELKDRVVAPEVGQPLSWTADGLLSD
jgi:L-ascorbate metabolism protein UlaG (beta-lactamase superfamily)